MSAKKIVIPFLAMLAACQHSPSKNSAMTSAPVSQQRVEAARTETRILADQPGADLRVEGGRTRVLMIFDRPDGYLVHAKSETNPPDLVRGDLLRLQRSRAEAFNEALVTNCDACSGVDVPLASETLPTRLLTSLTDKASARQEPTVRELQEVRTSVPESRYLWIVFGTLEEAEGMAQVRSFIYDSKSLKLLHAVEVKAWDEVSQGDPEALDPVIRQAFLRLTETLTP